MRNRENLAKLSAYLKSLPEDYEHFNMSVYFADPANPADAIKYALENGGVGACGTVACAVGHGPSAGILFPNERRFFDSAIYDFRTDTWIEGTPNWSKYSREFFICRMTERLEWEWCFGGSWSEYDNTPMGAALRIDWLLAGNLVPEDFDSEGGNFDELIEMYRGENTDV